MSVCVWGTPEDRNTPHRKEQRSEGKEADTPQLQKNRVFGQKCPAADHRRD